jgi:FlaA1/EpsC-like NDP-sugar epimerase
MLENLLDLPRTTKRIISLIYDAIALACAFYFATCMRLGTFDIPITRNEITAISITIAITLGLFIRMGMYRAILRYMSAQAMLTIVACVAMSGLILATTSFFTFSKVPRSVPFIYITTALLLIGGPRMLIRGIIIMLDHQGLGARQPVIVYGASHTGHQLALALQSSHFKVIAFVDEDPAMQGRLLANVRVYSPSMIESLVRKHKVQKVLLALDDTPVSRRAAIVESLESLQVEVQTLPAFSDLVSGKARIEHIRDVDIEDLLGREPIAPNPDLMHACIENKMVMVTGAGGSIGSELCRQIIRQKPAALILFELNEYSLYRIEQELQKELVSLKLPGLKLVPLIGSVQNGARLESIMRTYEVQTVYHAAAYKHVPLVEHNIVEGVRNNVLGTWHCAEAAVKAGVESFVLISTDKAVRPTNIMGASKRMAELVLQGLSQSQEVTRFTMVRFGNVLGSSGSVIPLFRQQIKNGGPVTVTHPEIIRYFMTIPEAAELVIQAGAMGRGGDVFVLDMGEPVRIEDLARKMIHLSGLSVKDAQHPDGDIAIEYTGLRPGEKLYEELLIGDKVSGTDHPRIMRAEEQRLGWDETQQLLTKLESACNHYLCDLVQELLMQAPTGYQPPESLNDAVWLGSQKNSGAKLRLISNNP